MKVINEYTAKVDKLCSLHKQIEKLKAEAMELEGFFAVKAKSDLVNVKGKTVKYTGSEKNEICATTATSVNISNLGILKKILGKEGFEKFIKKEIKYSIKNAPVGRVFAGITRDEFVTEKPGDVIKEFCRQREIADSLTNKCKGDIHFEKDKQVLMELGGLSEENAEYFAYFFAEAVCGTEFGKIIGTGEYSNDFNKAVEELKKAVCTSVTEKIKVVY